MHGSGTTCDLLLLLMLMLLLLLLLLLMLLMLLLSYYPLQDHHRARRLQYPPLLRPTQRTLQRKFVLQDRED
jgi:hypothetical protein